MPRTARASVGGLCYHVINWGNARGEVFHKPEDYAAFCQLLQQAAGRVRMRLLACCLMPNHFHLALWPRHDERRKGDMLLYFVAENWLRSSLRGHGATEGGVSVDASPVPLPPTVGTWVNEPMTDAEVESLRRSVNGGTPYGTEAWTRRMAERLGLEASLRPRGRPPKAAAK